MKAQLIDVSFESKRTIQVKKVDTSFLENPFHFHNLCELVWVEESFGKRIVGDHIDNFANGDLVLMSPNLPHIWQNDSVFFQKKKEYRSKAIVIYFPSDFLLSLSDELSVLQPTQELITRASRGLKFYGSTLTSVTELLTKIGNSTGLKKIVYFLNIIEILSHSSEYNFLASVGYKNVHDEKDASRINKVYQYSIHNFNKNISIEEIAKVCNMSPTAFCRFFKSRTKKSYIQFLNEIKVGHACKLLQEEDCSVANACYESGFNNFTNFNKFFKLIKNKTASEYKKTLFKTN